MSLRYPTKTKKKRALKSIISKGRKLWSSEAMSTQDFVALEKICMKNLKRLG